MSQDIVRTLRGNVEFAFSLVGRFTEVCPDEIWNGKFGGWATARQLYHTLTAAEFFTRAPGAAPLPNPCADAGDLSAAEGRIPGKTETEKFFAEVKTVVDAYMDGLDDAALTRRNEGVSAAIGRDTTHGNVMVLLAAHTLYHLGACDAALREKGLKGVF